MRVVLFPVLLGQTGSLAQEGRPFTAPVLTSSAECQTPSCPSSSHSWLQGLALQDIPGTVKYRSTGSVFPEFIFEPLTPTCSRCSFSHLISFPAHPRARTAERSSGLHSGSQEHSLDSME